MPAGAGNQTLTLPYPFELDVDVINRYLYKIIQPGITEGGLLSNPSGDNVTIAPFVLFFQCTTGEMVRVETTSDVTIEVSETDPYLVYTLNWTDVADHFGTFRADSDDGNFNGNDIYSNEIVFGKATYTTGVITGIDYTDRTYALVDTSKNVYVEEDLQVKGNSTFKGNITAEADLILPLSVPSSPVEGSCYFDSGTDILYIYNGTSWVSTTLT